MFYNLFIVTCADTTRTSTVEYLQQLEFNGPLYLGALQSSTAESLWKDSLGSTDSLTACVGYVMDTPSLYVLIGVFGFCIYFYIYLIRLMSVTNINDYPNCLLYL